MGAYVAGHKTSTWVCRHAFLTTICWRMVTCRASVPILLLTSATAEHAQALTGSRMGAATAAQHLDDMFGDGGSNSRAGGAATTVVVVDEMDLLLNRNQHVRTSMPAAKCSYMYCSGIQNAAFWSYGFVQIV